MTYMYVVLTHQMNFGCVNYRDANYLAFKLAANKVEFKIWSNKTGDWADDYPATNTIQRSPICIGEPLELHDFGPRGGSDVSLAYHAALALFAAAPKMAATKSTIVRNGLRGPREKQFKNKCPASYYKIMANGYDLPGSAHITDDGKCSNCGVPVKMHRVFGNAGLIPLHNLPDDYYTTKD